MLETLKARIAELIKRMRGQENVLDYICGSEALPLPYSPEEENAMTGHFPLLSLCEVRFITG